MIELGEANGAGFLQSVSQMTYELAQHAHLEVALFFRIRVVVSPPLGGSHGLELEHGECDVRATEIVGSRGTINVWARLQ